MNWNRLGSSLVRWFRPAAVPVASPEPAWGQLQADCWSGIEPPADETDGKTWAWWIAQRGDLIPGWTFCRFGNLLGEDKLAMVYGYVRGSFGIWSKPFGICKTVDDDLVKSVELLVSITHIPSGQGIGVFADREVAIEAAELAERVSSAWATETDITPALNVAVERTRAAWDYAGFVPCINAHAHDRPGDPALHIIGRSLESISEGKPERLS